jgi:hypothetical protein
LYGGHLSSFLLLILRPPGSPVGAGAAAHHYESWSDFTSRRSSVIRILPFPLRSSYGQTSRLLRVGRPAEELAPMELLAQQWNYVIGVMAASRIFVVFRARSQGRLRTRVRGLCFGLGAVGTDDEVLVAGKCRMGAKPT